MTVWIDFDVAVLNCKSQCVHEMNVNPIVVSGVVIRS